MGRHKMKQERILIAEDYNNQLSSNFYSAIRQLRKTLTNEKLGEVGLTLDSNVLRDILSGGNETETKVREKLKEQLLNGYQLPAVKRSNEELTEKLLKDFLIMATKAKSTMSDFRFIPIECFYVDAAKSIELDKQGEIILKEASNLYIDKPEQIEVYKQALKVLDEVKKLGDMADKYKCSAFGARGILTILPNDEMVIVPENVVDCHPDGLWMRAR